jgi:hypothetical protein
MDSRLTSRQPVYLSARTWERQSRSCHIAHRAERAAKNVRTSRPHQPEQINRCESQMLRLSETTESVVDSSAETYFEK